MNKRSQLYQCVLGLLVGVLLIPPPVAQAQWAVYDAAQYAIQAEKKAEEAIRWVEHFTTLTGVLSQAENLVTKQNVAISTMANIGRTVRASFQLKDQLEALVTTRLNAIKRIRDRARDGIFDPEQDMRDLDDYLQSSIGRSSQDTIANRERLARMDNELEKWQYDLKIKNEKLAWAQKRQKETKDSLKEQEDKPEGQRCASCVAGLTQELAGYEALITQLETEIADLECKIEGRVKDYSVRVEEQQKFGTRVVMMNDAWGKFNDALDQLNRQINTSP